jgi:hypothetical protein
MIILIKGGRRESWADPAAALIVIQQAWAKA